jgi:16S rRNA processing protein RimM
VAAPRLVTAGRVGRSHGLDGGFAVEQPDNPFAVGTIVQIAGTSRRVERRAGTDDRPLVRLEGIRDREAARELRGELLLVEDVLGEGEWLAEDLVGCRIEGLGEVTAIVGGSSCDVLELEGGALVPLVSDAVVRVDTAAKLIEIDRRFLRLDGEAR